MTFIFPNKLAVLGEFKEFPTPPDTHTHADVQITSPQRFFHFMCKDNDNSFRKWGNECIVVKNHEMGNES